MRWLPWLIAFGGVLGWQLLARSAANPYFPPPLAIARAAHGLWLSGPPSRLFLTPVVVHDIVPSVARLLGAWAIASSLGVLVGIFLGLRPRLLDYASPVLALCRALPPPTLVPVFLVVFSIGPPMELCTIVAGVIWPVLLDSIEGARSLDAVKLDTARAFRIGALRALGGIVLPAALPKVCAGLRLSLALALILMVVSELVGSTSGIGYQLASAQGNFDLPAMWAWIGLLGALGFGLNGALVAIERRLLVWHRGAARTFEG